MEEEHVKVKKTRAPSTPNPTYCRDEAGNLVPAHPKQSSWHINYIQNPQPNNRNG